MLGTSRHWLSSQLAHNVRLSLFKPPPYYRANHIVCTIGPSTQSVDALKELIKRGMTIARMNFSHGTHEYHQRTVENARRAARELDVVVGLALDTKGPEIRTGRFIGGEADMRRGETCLVTTDPECIESGTKDKFYVDYKSLPDALAAGDSLCIDDGTLVLRVLGREDDFTLKCAIESTRTISDRRGVNLPGVDVDLPAVSEKDRDDLMFAVKHDVDFVFASFIRSPHQVSDVRAALGPQGKEIMIISKIENHQGVQNIDAIIERSDGIMVARGDLGVGIPAEKVVVAQKMLISKCNVAGKPVICATQMLESMTVNPRPTRAEVSDVTNAVLDGADCVMLSGETAKGKYPNEVVQYMARICLEAQSAVNHAIVRENIKSLQKIPMSFEEAVCSCAVSSVYDTGAKAFIAISYSGDSARLVSKYRPNCPIIVVTRRRRTVREVTISHSMEGTFYDEELLGADENGDKCVALGVEYAKKKGYVKPGDYVVVVQADNTVVGYSNQSRILVVSDNKSSS